MFGESNFVGQSTVPATCIRSGYRSVPLKNNFSEELELSGKQLSTAKSKKSHLSVFPLHKPRVVIKLEIFGLEKVFDQCLGPNYPKFGWRCSQRP